MAVSVGVVVSLIISCVLLFISMVFSAMSATASNNKDDKEAHKWSTVSAVVCGLAVFLLVVVLIIYIRHEHIAAAANLRLAQYVDRMRAGQAVKSAIPSDVI